MVLKKYGSQILLNVGLGCLGIMTAFMAPVAFGEKWGLYIAGMLIVTTLYCFQDALRAYVNWWYPHSWRRLQAKKARRWDDSWVQKLDVDLEEICKED